MREEIKEKFVTHYLNKKNNRQPFPCTNRFGWTYQPRLWAETPEDVTCKRCIEMLKKWKKI